MGSSFSYCSALALRLGWRLKQQRLAPFKLVQPLPRVSSEG
uniref:Uncharacterized protein n=1 Tax=Arundo donax TaxID=35708 RepID=A0A0A8YS49_ARUDO